jgi:glycolate oxidase iron-sulfur subunit
MDYAGPQGEAMAGAVERCVHCGFCLPSCPTYVLTGEEMNSPRGRIVLMKEVLEGRLELDEVTPYIDPCLGCLACVTSCPSGVQYGDLLTPFRMQAETRRKRPLAERLLRRLVLATLPYPRRFQPLARLGSFARPFRNLLPRALRGALDLLPNRIPSPLPFPERVPAQGDRRARVMLLRTCAQQVLDPEIDAATVRVLARNGVEVVLPPNQGCCGALSAHTGAGEQAKAFAKGVLNVLPDDVDAVITNAAGCGSGIHEYPLWLAGEPEEGAARTLSRKARDISAFLSELGPLRPPDLRQPLKVAYHDACHLAHAQGVTLPPRELLGLIGGLEVIELSNPEICCGSAGTYNLEQPDNAAELGSRKAESVIAVGTDAVASGNIGCLTQIGIHLERQGHPIPIYHTVQLLDLAYQGA